MHVGAMQSQEPLGGLAKDPISFQKLRRSILNISSHIMTMLDSGKDRNLIRSWTNRFWSLDLQIVIRSIFYYFSTGLYEYCLYYIPQLRFKNQQAIITESTNETAAPFIQFFFKEWITILFLFYAMCCILDAAYSS